MSTGVIPRDEESRQFPRCRPESTRFWKDLQRAVRRNDTMFAVRRGHGDLSRLRPRRADWWLGLVADFAFASNPASESSSLHGRNGYEAHCVILQTLAGTPTP